MRRLPTPRLPFLAALIAATSLAAACDVVSGGSVIAEATLKESFSVGSAPTVTVGSFNGSITVTTGVDRTVEATVVKRGAGNDEAGAQADLEKVEVRFTHTEDDVEVSIRRTDTGLGGGNSGGDVELIVPPGASVDLETTNGAISVANLEGSVTARSSNGSISLEGGNGVTADTSNASITVRDTTGRHELATTNGRILIQGARDAVVTAETSNSGVDFAGALAAGDHTIRTSNGPITVLLPPELSFSLTGATSNGDISSDFDLPITGDQVEGDVGSDPQVSIDLATSNAPISIRRQDPTDGSSRSQAPATAERAPSYTTRYGRGVQPADGGCPRMDVPPIRSERLELVSMSPAFLELVLGGARDEAARALGVPLPEAWPGDGESTLRRRRHQMAADEGTQPWLLRAIVRREPEPEMVGHINFHGPPDAEGIAEVGYSVLPAHRRRGYATEAVRAMLDWATREHGVHRFRASVSPENAPSLAVVRRLGFTRTGEQWDEEDGLELVFDLAGWRG